MATTIPGLAGPGSIPGKLLPGCCVPCPLHALLLFVVSGESSTIQLMLCDCWESIGLTHSAVLHVEADESRGAIGLDEDPDS